MLTEGEHRLLVAHYDRVASLSLRQFGEMPISWVSYPFGLKDRGVHHRDAGEVPATVHTVPVTTPSGVHEYVALAVNSLLWLVHAKYAVEFLSWTPRPEDLTRPLFAHLTLEPSAGTTIADVRAAARAVRFALRADGRDAIAVLDGARGLTLWIDARGAATRLDAIFYVEGVAARVVASEPDLATTAWLRADRGARIYLGTKSNFPGNGVALPYAVRGMPGFPVAWPVAWERIDDVDNGDVTIGNVAHLLDRDGDVFAELASVLPASATFRAAGEARTEGAPAARHAFAIAGDLEAKPAPQGREYLIDAALRVLADGRTATAQEIRDAAVAAGLIPATTLTKYVYAALHEYIIRTLGAGRRPPFVQLDRSESFRLNQPADPWPDADLAPPPRWIADDAVAALQKRLVETATGADPAAFEIAVCDAFAALGFVARHVGGGGKPDGVLTAPLGPAGWRATVECKTASPGQNVANPRPEEPAKFREAFAATRALLIGPAFGNDVSFLDELRVHDVALWTTDDLGLALEHQMTPAELEVAFAAGAVSDRLAAIVWERAHGERKRVAVVAEMVRRLGWQAQVRLAESAGAASPKLTSDVLLLLVDQALAEIDHTLLVTRELLEAALVVLRADGVVRTLDTDGTIVVVVPAAASAEGA